MKTEEYAVAVLGAGAAGLAAAAETSSAGLSTLVIDREKRPGGILLQCIHNGFGLRCFNEELTGPEYAERAARKTEESGAVFALGCSATSLRIREDGTFELLLLSGADGVRKIHARAVFLATGCRERTRASLAIPGTRPAGVFTAGAAQKLLNREGMLPGRSAVIVGSGDIGLIMARRLRWSGIEVKAVIELLPHPSGLPRNVAQCLDDFAIPLYLEHAVVRICGKDRVEGVDAAPLENGVPNPEKRFHIECDTVLFSVGLIPENELASSAGVVLNPATGGAMVDANYETTVPGIFSAGNVLHVHDLVDFVSEEAARAARNIPARLAGTEPGKRIRARAGANLKYVVPSWYFPGRKTLFSFRPLIVAENGWLRAEINGTTVWRKRMPFVRPAEMITAEVEAEQLSGEGEVVFHLQEGETE